MFLFRIFVIEIITKTITTMTNEMDFYKEYVCGKTTITRCDYEELPSGMNTSSLTDEDMQKLANAIESEMETWHEWLENGDISEDKHNEHWWEVMEYLGSAFGMTYYEDEDEDETEDDEESNRMWEEFIKRVDDSYKK